MTNPRAQRRGKRTFRNILNNVASNNAMSLMGRARLANQIAKSMRGRSRERAYGIKTQTLLTLTTRFPERVRVLNDRNTPSFVLVKATNSPFGLHAPAYLFEYSARGFDQVPRVAAMAQGR
jgi:hypothetical protein